MYLYSLPTTSYFPTACTLLLHLQADSAFWKEEGVVRHVCFCTWTVDRLCLHGVAGRTQTEHFSDCLPSTFWRWMDRDTHTQTDILRTRVVTTTKPAWHEKQAGGTTMAWLPGMARWAAFFSAPRRWGILILYIVVVDSGAWLGSFLPLSSLSLSLL